MAKKDLKAIMNQRLAEAEAALKQASERNLNTFKRNTSDNDPAAQSSSNQIDKNWSVSIPNDVTNVGTEVYTAPTANPKRPRAYTISYNANTNTLVIIMRSGAWWQYNDVSPTVWMGLKNSPSTNDYLPVIEAACSSHHIADIDALSAGTKERLNYTASIASRVQNGGLQTLDDSLFGSRE
jgi:hypothetical protein